MKKEDVLEVLKCVYDPDYRDKSIVEMGLVSEDDIKIDDEIEVAYTLTAPMCPFSAAIGVMIKYALEKEFNRSVRVRLKSHFQDERVNELLSDKNKQAEILGKLKELGILKLCVRI